MLVTCYYMHKDITSLENDLKKNYFMYFKRKLYQGEDYLNLHTNLPIFFFDDAMSLFQKYFNH